MMTKQDVASLALKVMGVWLLLWCGLTIVVSIVTMVIALFHFEGPGWEEVGTAAGALAVTGVVFWAIGGITLSSDKLAKRLFPADEPLAEAAQAPSTADLQSIAFSVLGTYLVITGLARVVGLLSSVLMFLNQDLFPEGQMHIRRMMPQGLMRALQVALGSYLFVCSGQVAALWSRLQRPRENGT
jgi:hypothetical protein